MNIHFHEKKQEYIQDISVEILKKIIRKPVAEIKPGSPVSQIPRRSYLDEKEIINLGKIQGPVDSHRSVGSKYFEKFRGFEEERVGFDSTGFEIIYKLSHSLLKETSIKNTIGEKFIVDTIFDWAIKFTKKETIDHLEQYLVTNCDAAIQTYNLLFPVLYLDSDREFTLGTVRFLYISQQTIDRLSLKLPVEKRADYAKLLAAYKGQLLAQCTLTAEKSKAIERAVEQVTLAVDVLRITTPTIEDAQFPIFFDLDFRNPHQQGSKVIVQESDAEEHFSMQYFRIAHPFVIDPMAWEIMLKCELGVLHDFISRTNTAQTELQGLLLRAVRNFSKAMGAHDLHERTVQVFTVLESLLLPNENCQIVDSVCKYLPKLITSDPEERKSAVSAVKSLYSIRSKVIHHAKKNPFEVQELSVVQICTRALIIQLIKLSKTRSTKQQVLSEIDDLINRA